MAAAVVEYRCSHPKYPHAFTYAGIPSGCQCWVHGKQCTYPIEAVGEGSKAINQQLKERNSGQPSDQEV